MPIRVVGIAIKLIPRMYTEAANPPISPITPPPKQNSTSEREALPFKRKERMLCTVSSRLFSSPAETTRLRTSIPNARRAADTSSRKSGATLLSVRINTLPQGKKRQISMPNSLSDVPMSISYCVFLPSELKTMRSIPISLQKQDFRKAELMQCRFRPSDSCIYHNPFYRFLQQDKTSQNAPGFDAGKTAACE